MGRTLSLSLSDPTEAPEYGLREEEVTSSMVRYDSRSFDPYVESGEMGFTKDGQYHVWKWWDVAVTEEFRLAPLRTTRIEEKLQLLGKIEDWFLKNKTEVATMKKTLKVGMFFVTGLFSGFVFAYKRYDLCGM
ncbi:unnamed protein product [Cochlearia groenlandica]